MLMTHTPTDNTRETGRYVSVIGDAFDLEMGVMIMRNVQSLPLQPDGSPLKGSSPPVGTIDV
jgi:hypothetical protein